MIRPDVDHFLCCCFVCWWESWKRVFFSFSNHRFCLVKIRVFCTNSRQTKATDNYIIAGMIRNLGNCCYSLRIVNKRQTRETSCHPHRFFCVSPFSLFICSLFQHLLQLLCRPSQGVCCKMWDNNQSTKLISINLIGSDSYENGLTHRWLFDSIVRKWF